ncbi:MAG TPA: ABC transporter substrate-binding protein, partial [Candidatus Baltobacteraceae bacterium]|nr:ABC transporter substrate-binding protein [Candidatus Baltobacteraceae bacterium]
MRRSRFIAAAASIPLAMGSTVAAAPPRAGRRVAFAYVPVLAAAPIMAANDRGYFADAGLDVELITIATAQDAIALLARGRLDAAAGGLSAAFFNAVHRGFKVRLAGSLAWIPKRGHPTALLVRSDLYQSGLRTPQQLRGHRIGLIGGLGTASSYYLGALIAPLTFADVELIPLNGGDQGIALKRKSIAAAFAWNPFTQAFERGGIAKIVGLPAAQTCTSGTIFGERMLSEPALAKALFSAVDRAITDIAGAGYYDPKNVAAFAKHTGQPASSLAQEDRYDYRPGMPIDRPTLDAMQRLFIAEKTLAYKTPVEDSRLIWHR